MMLIVPFSLEDEIDFGKFCKIRWWESCPLFLGGIPSQFKDNLALEITNRHIKLLYGDIILRYHALGSTNIQCYFEMHPYRIVYLKKEDDSIKNLIKVAKEKHYLETVK